MSLRTRSSEHLLADFDEVLAGARAVFDDLATAHAAEIHFLKIEIEHLKSTTTPKGQSGKSRGPSGKALLKSQSETLGSVGPSPGDDSVFDLSISESEVADDTTNYKSEEGQRFALKNSMVTSGNISRGSPTGEIRTPEARTEDDFLGIWEAISDGGENGIEAVIGSLVEVELESDDGGLELLSSVGLGLEPCGNSSSPALRVVLSQQPLEIPITTGGSSSNLSMLAPLPISKYATTLQKRPSNPLSRAANGDSASRRPTAEDANALAEQSGVGLKVGDRILEVNGSAIDTGSMLKALTGTTVRAVAWTDTEYKLPFKGRQWEGKAIHVVARHPECSSNIIMSLIECRANMDDECWSTANGETRYIQPLYLAAGAGNVKALNALLEANADPNAPAKIQKGSARPEHHYYTLHEAAFFDQAHAARELLQYGADVRLTNTFGDTALHMAAKAGAVTVARALTASHNNNLKEAVSVTNKDGMTPLMVAVNHHKFPYEKLHLISGRKWEDILGVARVSPLAAKELLKNQRHGLRHQRSQVHPSWARCENNDDQDVVKKWTELMRLSPASASELLEVLTDTPDVVDKTRNPLPQRSRLSEKAWAMKVAYNADLTWDVGNEYKPRPWQQDLCPTESKRTLFEKLLCLNEQAYKLVQCTTRVMRLPNVMRTDVLDKIAHTHELSVFARLSTQAVLTMAWRSIVRQYYQFLIMTRVVEMSLLLVCCVYNTLDPDISRFIWSALVAWWLRDCVYFACSITRVMKKRSQREFFLDMGPIHVIPIGSMAWLVWSAAQQEDYNLGTLSIQLAASVIVRWVQLCHTLSSFRVMGRWLLPIMRSFKPMGGIIVITVFAFTGLMMSLLALTGLHRDSSITILLRFYRLLFMSDDSTVEVVLFREPQTVDQDTFVFTLVFFMVCTIGFSICLLNLFIAVHGEAYDSAQEDAEVEFLKERARLCFEVFKIPCFPERLVFFGENRRKAAQGIYAVSIVMWASLMLVPVLIPDCACAQATLLPATVFLFIGQILADSVLRQRPWRDHRACEMRPCKACQKAGVILQNYIWICHRADYDEINFLMTDSDSNQPRNGLRGRLCSLKSDSASRISRLAGEVGDLQAKIAELPGLIKAQAEEQFKSLSSFQRNMRAMIQEADHGAHSAISSPRSRTSFRLRLSDQRPSSAEKRGSSLDLGATADVGSPVGGRPSGPAAVPSSLQPWSTGASWSMARKSQPTS